MAVFLKGNEYWRDLFCTSMIMGGRVDTCIPVCVCVCVCVFVSGKQITYKKKS